MAKRGIKVKELARELGVTSRTLMDRCRASGMAVQNSITRLSPADVALVRTWFAASAEVRTPEAVDTPGNNPGAE